MRIEGLYAITPDRAACDFVRLPRLCELALAGGARLLQYRRKDTAIAERFEEARQLRALCARYGAAFIVNDDVELCLRVAADGVHLGREDGSIARARQQLGDSAIIGASCYNELERARAAVREGVSYVAFGSFFPSMIKPNAVRPAFDLLSNARAELECPIVAIGGITRSNAAALIAAGADAVAVITDLFSVPDVCASAAEFAALFTGLGQTYVKAAKS